MVSGFSGFPFGRRVPPPYWPQYLWAGRGATPPPPGHTGLYHFAILFPNRKELAKVLRRLLEARYPLQGAADHGVSEAIYLADPDGNGVELCVDRPPEAWPRDGQGRLKMGSRPLDLEGLLAEVKDEEGQNG